MAKAKFIDREIVFQEVPSEISLCYYIANCPHHCLGCHSPQLSKDIGEPLYTALVFNDLDRYKEKGISCVLLMGGDNSDDIIDCLKIVREFGLKTALYSGCKPETFNKGLIPYLDYVKIGPYIKELGGLDHTTTNQKFFRVTNGTLEDLTYLFWNKHKEMSGE